MIEVVKNIRCEEDFEGLKIKFGALAVFFFCEDCGPCQKVAPLAEEISEENPLVHFVKLNVSGCPELVNVLPVNDTPCFMFFKNGCRTDTVYTGAPFKLISSVEKLTKNVMRVTSIAELDRQLVVFECCMVYFFAEWNPESTKFVNELETFAVNNKVKILKIDVNECEDIAVLHKIVSIPTFIIFKKAIQIDSVFGPFSLEMIQRIANRLLEY